MNNKEFSLNYGWKFMLKEHEDVQGLDFNHFLPHTKAGTMCGYLEDMLLSAEWKDVDVPYDWGGELPFEEDASPTHGFKKMARGVFLRTFILPKEAQGKIIYLEFEGIRGDSIVYVNGTETARNRCGYNGFWIDISSYIKEAGEVNWIYVEIDAAHLEGWWYEGGGIYRDVKLHIKDIVHFEPHGIYAVPEKKENGWVISAEIPIINYFGKEQKYSLQMKLGEKTVYCDEHWINKDKETVRFEIPVNSPNLWSPESPNIYKATFICNSEEEAFNIAFRTIETNINDGLLLNGKKYEIKGTCVHQDHGGIGIGLTKAVIRYRMEKIKELGFNAYRSAHHPATPYLLEVCDELGIFVLNENRNFSSSRETLDEVKSMVLYSRNHPSLFMYSLYNEEGLQKGAAGGKITRDIVNTVRKYDYHTKTTAALLYNECIADGNGAEELDIAGFNYMMDRYEEFHQKYPDKVILGTENSLVFSTRGVYETSVENQYFDNSGDNVAKGENGSLWGVPFWETVEKAREYPYVIGVFLWCAFDYRGEPAPYYSGPSVSSHWGIMDSCGFEKDTSYIVKSIYSRDAVLHIVPSINGGRVTAFTNCDEVELFADGVSAGTVKPEKCRAQWSISSANVLKAVGKKEKEQITDKVIFPGEKYAIKIENATQKDVDGTFVLNISTVDKDGNFVQDANDEICVKTDGGVLLGIGNGNPTSRESDIANTHKLFNGRCQVIVRAKADVIKCSVMGDGLLPADITINTNAQVSNAVYNRYDLCECFRYDLPVTKEEARLLEWTDENKLHWNIEVMYGNTKLYKDDEYGSKLYLFNTEKLKGKKVRLYINNFKGKLTVINDNDIVREVVSDTLADEIIKIEYMSDKLKIYPERTNEFSLKLPIAVEWE